MDAPSFSHCLPGPHSCSLPSAPASRPLHLPPPPAPLLRHVPAATSRLGHPGYPHPSWSPRAGQMIAKGLSQQERPSLASCPCSGGEGAAGSGGKHIPGRSDQKQPRTRPGPQPLLCGRALVVNRVRAAGIPGNREQRWAGLQEGGCQHERQPGTSKVISDGLATDLVPPAQGILLQEMGVLLATTPHPAPRPSPGPGSGHPGNHRQRNAGLPREPRQHGQSRQTGAGGLVSPTFQEPTRPLLSMRGLGKGVPQGYIQTCRTKHAGEDAVSGGYPVG